MNNWKSILIGVGIDAKFLTGNHCACPMCGGKDRFRFDDYQKKGNWFCNQCGSGNGMELIKQVNGISEFKDAVKLAEENGYVNPNMFKHYTHEPTAEEDSKLATSKEKLSKILESMIPAKGTPAELYLKKRKLDLVQPWTYRGAEVQAYFLPEDEFWSDDGTKSIRQAIAWKIWRGDGQKYGLHRTYIDNDGNKDQVDRPKRITPRILPKKRMDEGGYLSIPLVKGDNSILILAEGIETALSAWSIMKYVHGENCHAMALNNDAGISSFMPHSNQIKYLVFADRDDKRAGQFAAVECVKRLHKNFDVNVVMPPDTSRDWNDIWIQGDQTELSTLPFEYWL